MKASGFTAVVAVVYTHVVSGEVYQKVIVMRRELVISLRYI